MARAGACRATSALMAVSAFLRAPWAVSLAMKSTINSRPRPPLGATRATSCSVHASREISHGQGSSSSTLRPSSWCSSKPVIASRRGLRSSARRGTSCDEATVESAAKTSSCREVLSREAWTERAEAHRARVRALTDGSVHHDQKDPIFNFLFEYYHFKPRMLLQWTPGFDVYLEDADPSLRGCPLPQKAWEPGADGGGSYNPFELGVKRRATIQWVRDFLAETTARAPVFHCFGLHEWAMLYRPPGVERDARSLYQALPLRVSQEEINSMVEGKGGSMGCTHFDAFRFFTPEAKPLNSDQLDREGQRSNDQPGCIHANMDLFKWALRLWPLLPSEKLADALELAVSCRMLDMRASPYDLTAHGKVPDNVIGKGGGRVGGLPPESWDPTPVCIETEEGRKVYQQRQWELYRRSMPLRLALLSHADKLLETWGQ